MRHARARSRCPGINVKEEEEEGEELEIMCPDGAEAGDVITVTVDGDELELEIPEGVVAGETFSVRIE